MRRVLKGSVRRWPALIAVLAASTMSMGAAAPPATCQAGRVLMDEMTMTEVRAAIASGKTTVLLYNGSTEQTGPHVVLGKHNVKARYLDDPRIRATLRTHEPRSSRTLEAAISVSFKDVGAYPCLGVALERG